MFYLVSRKFLAMRNIALYSVHTFITENESNLVVAVVKAIADNFDEIIELDF